MIDQLTEHDRIELLARPSHLGRCHLKGRDGDAANVILTAVGHNLRRVLAWLKLWLRLFLHALCCVLALAPLVKQAS